MSKPKNISDKSYVRFSLDQRIEHLLFLISFSILGITGLVQKYYFSPVSQALIELMGGIEMTRIIHRINAVIMMAVSIYHIIALLYRLFVRRVSWTMLPGLDDLKHLIQDVAFYIGIRSRKAFYGRFNYAEKVEYLAVVWGTVVMAITGFMMWNPINTAKFLPGEWIPASKAAHGGEALLAVLAILVWHFYHVHIRHFNKSMFTGKLNHHEMEEEHPAELAIINVPKVQTDDDRMALRRRQQIFVPVAFSMAIVMGFGLYEFVTFEDSAITTIPRLESAEVYVPITPTPRPTATPTPTPDPNAPVGEGTWEGEFYELIRNRCSTCHANTAVGGLRMDTYENTLKGGETGPGIVPGSADQSIIVTVQQAGGHPGQLTTEELTSLIEWIQAGAPEK